MLKHHHIPTYTYADYRLWQGDWELISGYPHAMAPSPFFSHQVVCAEFIRTIGNELRAKACNCKVVSDLDWIIDEENVLRPDVMIVCGEQVEKHLEYAPAWILEVLSESSAYRDRIIKKELYALHGVRYYLIADTDKKSVEIYELVNGAYRLKEDGHFELTSHCSVDLDPEEIMKI